MEIGIFLLRVVVGLLMVGHGTQKLFGWFGGHGVAGTGGFMESLGYRPGRAYAVAGGLTETTLGVLLVLGFMTPLAGAMLIGVMLNAALTAHRGKGLWVTNGGAELPLVLGAVGAALAFTGASRWSVDDRLDLALYGKGWGIAAVVTGLAVGAMTLAARRADDDVDIDLREQEQERTEASAAESNEPATADR
jgi:putative oxidoreductase